MAYGDAAEVQKLAWGGTKASTPPIVTTSLQMVTTIINLELNLNADMSPVPQRITDIANLLAAEIVRQGREADLRSVRENAKVLLNQTKDQMTPFTQGAWGNMVFVQ